MIDFKELVKAGVHFGHQTSRWLPKMAPYIWGSRNNIHLIDVSKTAQHLERAAQFLQEVAAGGKQVLWVGTKKPARAVVQEVATKLDMPYVNHRWIGGTLSNFAQVKKSVTRLLHYEDVLEKAEKYPHYTKKELSKVKKNVERMKNVIGGIKKLTWPVGAIVLVDVNKEQSALQEAVKVGLPVVALVDTNADPSLVDYVIPANDDAPHSIAILLEYLGAAAEKGKQAALSKKTEKVKPVEEIQEEVVVKEAVVLVADEDEDEVGDTKETKREIKSKRVRATVKSVKQEEKKEDRDTDSKVKPRIKKQAAANDTQDKLAAKPIKRA